MLRKTAIALALISLAVGIHFVFGSLYGDAVDCGRVGGVGLVHGGRYPGCSDSALHGQAGSG